MDIFDKSSYDFRIVKGDTAILPFNIIEEDSGDELNVNSFASKFNVLDPVTKEVIPGLAKTHNDASPAGNGIYYYNDVYKPANHGMTKSSQLIVSLSIADTSLMDEGVYPYDLELADSYNRKTIKGNLIIASEVTESV